MHRAFVGFAGQRHEIHGFGQLQVGAFLSQLLHQFTHAASHIHLAVALAAADLEAHDALAIEPGRTGGLLHRVGDGAQIGQTQPASIGRGDLHRLERLGRFHPRKDAQRLLAAGQVRMPAGTLDLVAAQLGGDIAHGQPQCPQLQQVQIHMHLPVHATYARDLAHTLQGQQPAVQVIVDEPRQFLFVQPVGLQRIGQHRLRGQIHLVHHRIGHIRGQIGPHALNGRTDLIQGILHRLVQIEFHHHRHRAISQRGADVTLALDVDQRVFYLARHVILQLAGRGPLQ